MGQKSSKPKNQWDVPPPGMFGQPPYTNPPFIPPGYQPTPGPYAAYPSNAYGQAAMGMPQPQLNWLPQDKGTKRNKSRRSRSQSEQYGGGYAGTGIGLMFPERESCFGWGPEKLMIRQRTLHNHHEDHRKRVAARDGGPLNLQLPLIPVSAASLRWGQPTDLRRSIGHSIHPPRNQHERRL